MILTVPPLEAKGKAWPTLGPQVCAWMKSNLVHGPGDLRGMPYALDDEKEAIIARAYEVYPKGHAQAGRRRFKRVAISVRKGWAKTELAAALSAAELAPDAPVRCVGWDRKGNPVGGPVTDPFVPMVAYTEEQSDELAYAALKVMIEPIAGQFDIGGERIMRANGDGKAVSLSSSPSGNDGARTTFQVFDETHRFNTPRLRKAHSTMLANIPKRRAADAWSLEITTSYAPGEESIAEGTMKYARDVRDGKIRDSKLFFFHRQASESIELFDSDGTLIVDNLKRAVDEASGPVAVWSDTDGILSQFQDPSADIPYLRRVWLNQAIRATDRAFNTDLYAKLARPGATIPPGADVVLSFDGSRREDSSCLIATEIATGLQVAVGLWEKPESERVEKGKKHGEVASEWEIPSAEVNAAVKLAFDTWNVWRFYADPPKWEETVALWAAEYGEDRVIRFFTNQWSMMALAVDAFDSAMKAGEIHHDGDPRLVRHVGNCHRLLIGKRNDKGEKMFVVVKENKGSMNKIDAAVALIIGNQARLHALADGVGGGSVYDANGGTMEVW